jgi:hypothetical protein
MSDFKLLSIFKNKEQEVNSEVVESFEQIMKQNKENEERQKLERIKANKKVLKDYRIK